MGKQSYKPPRPFAEGRTCADIIPIPIDVAVNDHWGNGRHQHLWYELARCRKVVAAHCAFLRDIQRSKVVTS